VCSLQRADRKLSPWQAYVARWYVVTLTDELKVVLACHLCTVSV